MPPDAAAPSRRSQCLIGCGANLGSRREQLDQAIDMLRFMPGVEMLQVSQFVETRPIGGPAGQPPFLNAACLVETSFGPEEVLDMLAAVENTLHRERSTRWGPRTIDLDLLIYDDRVISTEHLQVPHPRMTTRRFVLEPAAQIAAKLRHPVAGCTIGELLDNISQRHLHIAVVGIPGSGAPEVASAVADVTLSRLLHAPAFIPLAGQPAGGRARDGHAADDWLDFAEACAGPLTRAFWPDDPHGTVTDYWLEGIRLAAASQLHSAAYDSFQDAFQQVVAETICPHVVLFLEVSPQTISDRLAYRAHAAGRSDVFGDLVVADTHDEIDTAVAPLLDLQEKLKASLLHGDGCCPRPKAVIQLAADDLGRAILDAVAAIEAMA